MIESQVFKLYNEERQRLQDRVKNKIEIEQKILKQLRKNMLKNKSGYFQLSDLFDIPDVLKYFQFFAITGDRNIGKTTALKNFLEEKVNEGAKKSKQVEFMFLRNLDTEIENLLPQMKQDWFSLNGWDYTSKNTGTIYSSTEAAKKRDVSQIVGHFKSVNSSAKYKSIEFKNVNYIVYDEFNNTSPIKEKYKKLITFLTTIERQKKNFYVILTANYINQNDDILTKLGLEQDKKAKQPLLIFNWISRSIMWNIPKNYYVNKLINNTLSYALAHNDFNTYLTQYAGTFGNTYQSNIFPIEKLARKKIWFKLVMDHSVYSIFYNDEKLVICSEDKYLTPPDTPIFCFDETTNLRHIKAKKLSEETILKLKNAWYNNKLFCDTPSIAEMIMVYFSNYKENEEFYAEI